MTPGVWEDLVEHKKGLEEQRNFAKDMFEVVCLLKDRDFRDKPLIDHRIEQMRDSYSFLEADVTITKRDNVITKSDKGVLRK